MSDTANNEVRIEISPTAKAIRASIEPAKYQLGILRNQIEEQGLSTNAVDTATMLINQVDDMVIEQTGKDLDDYNAIYDQAEGLEKELIQVQTELNELKEKHGDLEIESLEAKAAKEEANLNLKKVQSNLREALDTIKSLQAMDPVSLKKKNADQKKEIASKRDIIIKQLNEIRSLKGDVAKLKIEASQVSTANIQLHEHAESLNNKLVEKDGVNLTQPFAAVNNKTLIFYIHYMGYGITMSASDNNDPRIQILNDFGWHLMVRTNFAVDMMVNFTSWLSPIFPHPDFCPVVEEIPQALTDELHEQACERLKDTHPEFVARVEWAKSVALAQVNGLDDKQLELLKAGGFSSLYDVCELRQGRVKERCKGIGDAMETKIRNLCFNVVDDWEKDNFSLKKAS